MHEVKRIDPHAALLVLARRRARQAGRARPSSGCWSRSSPARHHPARVRDRPGQLPQLRRPGRQRQRRLPGPLRRPGHARRCVTMDEGTTVVDLSNPQNLRDDAAVAEELRAEPDRRGGRHPGRRRSSSPTTWCTAASPTRRRRRRWPPTHRRASPASRVPPASHGGPARRPAAARAAQGAAAAPTSATTARAPAAIASRRTGVDLDQPRVGRLPLHDNEGEHPQVAAAVLPRRPPRPDDRAPRRQRRHRGARARAPTLVAGGATDGASFEGGTVTVTGAPVLLKDINDYLTRRHAHARRHRRGDHGA